MSIFCLNLLIISPFWLFNSPLEGSQHPSWQQLDQRFILFMGPSVSAFHTVTQVPKPEY